VKRPETLKFFQSGFIAAAVSGAFDLGGNEVVIEAIPLSRKYKCLMGLPGCSIFCPALKATGDKRRRAIKSLSKVFNSVFLYFGPVCETSFIDAPHFDAEHRCGG